MDRREAIKWVLAAGATFSVVPGQAVEAFPPARGYGTDPDLMKVWKPGDLWPLTFTTGQRATVAALCDFILPADEKSPSASQLRVPDFIDEWISAPYSAQRADRQQILDGLAWLEARSHKGFECAFVDLSHEQKRHICDEICYLPKAQVALRRPAQFFARLRELTMSAFYTTPEGMKDIGYIGNVPLAKFDGPPPEVLAYLKLD